MNKTNLLLLLCVFFGLISSFWAFFVMTVTTFIRRSQGTTLFQAGDSNLSTRRRLAARKSILSQIFSARVKLYDLRTLWNVRSPNIPAHFPENEHFLTPCPTSLLSANANDFKNRHEAWVRGQFSLDRGWYRKIESRVNPVKKDTGDTASVGLTLCDAFFRFLSHWFSIY